MKNLSDEKVELLVFQEAKSGNLESGDTYYVSKNENFMLCAIADGLGNGPIAKESADVIPEILEKYPDDSLDELETVQMVESEIDGHLLHGPTDGSEAARAILKALDIATPKATLTALPATLAPEPRQKPRSAECTLF